MQLPASDLDPDGHARIDYQQVAALSCEASGRATRARPGTALCLVGDAATASGPDSGRVLVDLEFANMQPPYLKLFDLESADDRAPDRQSPDRQSPDGGGAGRHRPDRERAHRNRLELPRPRAQFGDASR
jgi:hypothetical protein